MMTNISRENNKNSKHHENIENNVVIYLVIHPICSNLIQGLPNLSLTLPLCISHSHASLILLLNNYHLSYSISTAPLNTALHCTALNYSSSQKFLSLSLSLSLFLSLSLSLPLSLLPPSLSLSLLLSLSFFIFLPSSLCLSLSLSLPHSLYLPHSLLFSLSPFLPLSLSFSLPLSHSPSLSLPLTLTHAGC